MRTAQEVVEILLKCILELLCVDYPKEHDVGEVFADVLKSKGISVEEEIFHLGLLMKEFPAFYFEKRYTEEQAKKAKEDATKVINFVKDLYDRLTGCA